MLLNYWDGKDFKELERPFFRLLILSFHTPKITRRILYCIFSIRPTGEAFVLNITNLDELLTVLLLNISEEQRPSHNILIRLRKAISSYLITLPATYITPEKNAPTLVLTTLEDKGIKIISGEKVDLDYEN
jgi:hypothetical protein